MLVLARRLGERVVVTMPDGRLVRVLLVDVDRGKVRLGFDAPPDVLVDREEVHARREAAKEAT